MSTPGLKSVVVLSTDGREDHYTAIRVTTEIAQWKLTAEDGSLVLVPMLGTRTVTVKAAESQ